MMGTALINDPRPPSHIANMDICSIKRKIVSGVCCTTLRPLLFQGSFNWVVGPTSSNQPSTRRREKNVYVYSVHIINDWLVKRAQQQKQGSLKFRGL